MIGSFCLEGNQVKYNVQFSLAGNNITSRSNISTSKFSIPLVNPCLEGSFSVTPTADTMTGKTQTLTQYFPKDQGKCVSSVVCVCVWVGGWVRACVCVCVACVCVHSMCACIACVRA